MKASKYNHFIDFDDQFIVGYNFLFSTILWVPKRAFPIINHHLSQLASPDEAKVADATSPWIKSLTEARFVIDNGFNELQAVTSRYKQSLFEKKQLRLTILPTLWCNFDCPYCFEFKRRKFLNENVGNALVKWMFRNFQDKKRIIIAWFGGEPLLATKAIKDLSYKLIKFSDEIGASYSASLTTNGYYLDSGVIEMLRDSMINNVQVTLDGDEGGHNKLRKERNGKGTFARIVSNLTNFCDHEEKCSLLLRVNCCDENYEGVYKMLGSLPQSVRDHASIFFRWIFPSESPRLSWRLQILRGWSHEHSKAVSQRTEGTCGKDGARPRGGVSVSMTEVVCMNLQPRR